MDNDLIALKEECAQLKAKVLDLINGIEKAHARDPALADIIAQIVASSNYETKEGRLRRVTDALGAFLVAELKNDADEIRRRQQEMEENIERAEDYLHVLTRVGSRLSSSKGKWAVSETWMRGLRNTCEGHFLNACDVTSLVSNFDIRKLYVMPLVTSDEDLNSRIFAVKEARRLQQKTKAPEEPLPDGPDAKKARLE
jgi:hypothetical protein